MDLEVAVLFHFCPWNVLGGLGSHTEDRDGLVLGPYQTQDLAAGEVYLEVLAEMVALEVLDGDSVDLEVLEEKVALAPSDSVDFGQRMIPRATSPCIDSPSTPGMSSSSDSYPCTTSSTPT
jgi:hypothetical protein